MIDFKNLQILIVEDDDMNFIYLKQIFKILGCGLKRVKTGHAAIAAIKDSDFNLIMMDIKLPDISGFEATKVIREKDPDIPIIAQTATKNPEDHDTAIESGCNYVLVKPFKIDDIRNLFQKLF